MSNTFIRYVLVIFGIVLIAGGCIYNGHTNEKHTAIQIFLSFIGLILIIISMVVMPQNTIGQPAPLQTGVLSLVPQIAAELNRAGDILRSVERYEGVPDVVREKALETSKRITILLSEVKDQPNEAKRTS